MIHDKNTMLSLTVCNASSEYLADWSQAHLQLPLHLFCRTPLNPMSFPFWANNCPANIGPITYDHLFASHFSRLAITLFSYIAVI